jgi:hypothetical protein
MITIPSSVDEVLYLGLGVVTGYVVLRIVRYFKERDS